MCLGLQVFSPADWEAAGFTDGTQFCERELKKALEGVAKHLFGGCSRGSVGGGRIYRGRGSDLGRHWRVI